MGYDLLNEPWLMGAPMELLEEFYRDATAAIREVDKEHILFWEGDNFAMDFDSFQEPEDMNTAFSCHYYPTVWEPELMASVQNREERKGKMRDILTRILSVGERLGRPVLCGEAGYEIDKSNVPATMALLEDTLDLFDEAGIPWTIWSYKDAQFMSLCFPESDTPWMQLANKLGKYWSQDMEKAQANRIMEELAALPGLAAAGEDLKYHMHFRQRAILYRFQYHRLLKPALEGLTREELLALPQAFRLENCGYHPKFSELLKTHGQGSPSAQM